jgi:hypothetical protein
MNQTKAEYAKLQWKSVFFVCFFGEAAVLLEALKVMRCRIRNHARCGDCVAHVTGEVYAALATPHLPRAAIISDQQELIGTVAFG